MNPYHHLSSSFRRSYLGNKEEGAGGASHLSGMVASLTPLPVIGVPVSATVWMELIHFSPSFRCLEVFLSPQLQLTTPPTQPCLLSGCCGSLILSRLKALLIFIFCYIVRVNKNE
ncbi:hypothetical protein Bca4012_095185 [Brassica carinata]